MKPITHQQAEDWLQSGTALDASQKADLSAHLSGCAECREYAAFHSMLSEELPQAYPFKRHTEREIRQKARAMESRLENRSWNSWLFQGTRSVFALTTMLIAAIGLTLVVFQLLAQQIGGREPNGFEPLTDIQITATAVVSQPGQQPTPAPSELHFSVQEYPFVGGESRPSTPSAAATPTAIPSTNSNLHISGVFQHEHIGYIGVGSKLVALDLSQPAVPQWLAESEALRSPVTRLIKIPDTTYPRAAAAAGNMLAIFDIADPRAIPLVSRFNLPGQIDSMILDIHPHIIYVSGPLDEQTDRYNGFVAVIDINNAEKPRLLDLIQTEQALQSLALSQPVLFASPVDAQGGVVAMRINETHQLSEPARVIPNLTVRSMTAVRDMLYIGADASLLTYNTSDPDHPQLVWKTDENGSGTPLGIIYGFALRPSNIYVAGYYPEGSQPPFRMAVTPPGPVQTGSTVDTGSTLSVGAGLMLVTGENRLEIYDVRDPENFKWIGSYPRQ